MIGILALQGDFAAHAAAFERLGAPTRLVRAPADLLELDGLVIPGGESTTMLKLLATHGLDAALRAFVAEKPTFGTCAGLILLARTVTDPAQASFGVMDVDVARNAYGRQIDSFVGDVDIDLDLDLDRNRDHDHDRGANGHPMPPIQGVFIRAPRIRRVGPGVRVLGRLAETGEPVLVAEGHLLGATFHPELTTDSRVHRHFLDRLSGSGRHAILRPPTEVRS
jgi:pyridoxal 5'-phosphate synthase pdxT subunit